MKKFFSLNHTLWAVFLILAVLVPLVTGEYIKSLFILICVWIMMTISINLIYGYTGQLSLGHAAFFGIGAYSFGLFALKAGFPFWGAFFASLMVTAVFHLLFEI